MIMDIAYYVFAATCVLGIAYEVIPERVIKFWRYRYDQERKRASSPQANRPTA